MIPPWLIPDHTNRRFDVRPFSTADRKICSRVSSSHANGGGVSGASVITTKHLVHSYCSFIKSRKTGIFGNIRRNSAMGEIE